MTHNVAPHMQNKKKNNDSLQKSNSYLLLSGAKDYHVYVILNNGSLDSLFLSEFKCG